MKQKIVTQRNKHQRRKQKYEIVSVERIIKELRKQREGSKVKKKIFKRTKKTSKEESKEMK